MYESGLIAAQTDAEGNVLPTSGWGPLLDGGLFGSKIWRRSSFGVDYRADYRRQPARPQFQGLSQIVGLQYQNQVSRRVTLFTGVNAGVMQRAFGLFAIPALPGSGDIGLPLNEVFDNRTIFAQGNVGASWQRSARMSVSASGSLFFAKRQSTALFNSQGLNGTLAVNYRSSLRTTWTAGLEHIRMRFPKAFSEFSSNRPYIQVSHRLGREWMARAATGFLMGDITGVEQVELNPVVAAILGRPTGTIAFERSVNFPSYEGGLQYLQERSVTSVGVVSGANSGNGLIRVAKRTAVTAGHSYSGIRKLSLGASGGYGRMESLGENLPGLTFRNVGGSANYVLAEHLQLSFQYDYRWFGTPQADTRKGQMISIGLTLTPSQLPLSIW